MATKYNKKLEEAPYDAGRASPKYPWVRGEMDLNGASKTVYANPDAFEESFTEDFHHSASFDIQENADDDKKGLKNSLRHEERHYTSGGHSSTSDGHSDRANLDQKGSLRENFAGDRGQSAAGNIYSGAGETQIGGAKSGSFNNDQGDTYTTTTGNRVSAHKGDTSIDHEGDYTNNTTGNRMEMVKGEYGMHVQQGNMDMQVDSGKMRLKTVGDTLFIDSSVKIVLTCGSSTITMQPGEIEIKSSSVKFVKA